jgi:ribonuclease HII
LSDFIAGVDEVGRGPLAGPVVAAAVILDPERPIEGLKDSKKLSPARRKQLSKIIRNQAIAYAFGRAEAAEIDEINILQATMLAMQRAVLALTTTPDQVKIDGNQAPELPFSTQCIVKGDSLVDEIKAASIIAKVARDQEMMQMHLVYPEYGFHRHKGYPTRQHLSALQEYGTSRHHRLSFAPCRAVQRSRNALERLGKDEVAGLK